MKILYLHGSDSADIGLRPAHLETQGFEVVSPMLDSDDFPAALAASQAAYSSYKPDVILGWSRGGAVAMNIETGTTPLVLLCPAWKKWGTASTIKPHSVILHSVQDDVIPYGDSEELLGNSSLPLDALIHVGSDHGLNDEVSLKALEWACHLFESTELPSWMVTVESQLPSISLTDSATDFVERVKTEIAQWVQKSTIPFFHLRKDPKTDEYGIIDKDRTGVFLRIASDHFILTASHGIRDAVNTGTYLFMSWDDDDDCSIPLLADQIATTDALTIDLAVIRLTKENSERLLKRHTPISLTDIVRYRQDASGLFLIYGYDRAGTELGSQHPLRKQEEPHVEPFMFVGARTNKMWSGKDLEYNPTIHLLIGMNRDSYSGQGKGELLPAHEGIEGISGCGIWLVADRSWNKKLENIGVDDCKLIAIEHRMMKRLVYWLERGLIWRSN